MLNPVVSAHRDALSALEHAKREVKCCTSNTSTKCEKPCPCAIYQEMLKCESDLENKTIALQQYNEQIIKQNDRESLKRIAEREQRNKMREARKERNQKQLKVLQRRELEKEEKEVQPVVKSLKGQAINGLTVQEYHRLRVEEGKNDKQIMQQYNIPNSNYYRWKTDNELTRTYKSSNSREEAKEHRDSKVVVASEVSKMEERIKQLTEELDEMTKKYNQTLLKLETAREMNETRQDMIVALDKELDIFKNATQLDNVPDYKAMYEAASDSAAHFESLYNEVIAAYEQDRKEVSELVQTQINNSDTQDLFAAQVKQWNKYESNLFGRIEVLKKENKRLHKYIKEMSI